MWKCPSSIQCWDSNPRPTHNHLTRAPVTNCFLVIAQTRMKYNNLTSFIASGTIVTPRGDWFVVGGMNRNNSYLASSELLDVLGADGSGEDVAGLWHHGPRLHHRTWKPCLVQVGWSWVWPDLANFHHLGKNLNNLVIFCDFIYYLARFWKYFG